jgi:hypothetical protein
VAFPTVAATNATAFSASTTNIVLNLPASIAANDLLTVFVNAHDDAGVTAPTLTTPSGWTQLFHAQSVGNARTLAAYYKVASGSEGATLSIAVDVTVSGASTSYRFTDYTGTPEAGTTATGTSTTPDPPNLTPSWGADDDTWIVVCACTNNTSDLTAPTNYGSLSQPRDSGSTQQLASATRDLNATSENPGTFANANNAGWSANTVAIRGVAAGQPTVKRAGGVEGMHSNSTRYVGGPKVWAPSMRKAA